MQCRLCRDLCNHAVPHLLQRINDHVAAVTRRQTTALLPWMFLRRRDFGHQLRLATFASHAPVPITLVSPLLAHLGTHLAYTWIETWITPFLEEGPPGRERAGGDVVPISSGGHLTSDRPSIMSKAPDLGPQCWPSAPGIGGCVASADETIFSLSFFRLVRRPPFSGNCNPCLQASPCMCSIAAARHTGFDLAASSRLIRLATPLTPLGEITERQTFAPPSPSVTLPAGLLEG